MLFDKKNSRNRYIALFKNFLINDHERVETEILFYLQLYFL